MEQLFNSLFSYQYYYEAVVLIALFIYLGKD